MATALHMTASREFVTALLDALRAAGADGAATLAPPKAGRDGRIAVDALEDLLARAARDTNDPAMALRAGHRFRVASHGRTGSIYAHARDLADVVALNARYQGLAIDLGRAELGARSGGPAMIFRPHDTAGAPPMHSLSMLMGAYVTAYRWLNWGSGEELVEVGIPFATGETFRQAAQTLLRCPVRLDPEVGYLVFTDRAMQTTLATHDAEKRARMAAQLDGLIGSVDAAASFRAAVGEALRGAMAAGAVTLDSVGARMELTPSTLRRRLRDQGTTFRGEADAMRRTVMVERFEAGDNLAEIAARLGYNDQAAFSRAVRRWYGVPPGQWRPGMALKRSGGIP